MTDAALALPRRNTLALGAALIGAGMALTVGGALAFEHLGGYIPCALCLEQRTPYYIGAPVMLGAALLAWVGRKGLAMAGLLAGAVLMAYAIYLGVFHAGAEWGFWPGPADCGEAAGAYDTGGGSILEQINTAKPPSCDEAAARFLGLSFAGWQVVAATGLLGACLWLLGRARRAI